MGVNLIIVIWWKYSHRKDETINITSIFFSSACTRHRSYFHVYKCIFSMPKKEWREIRKKNSKWVLKSFEHKKIYSYLVSHTTHGSTNWTQTKKTNWMLLKRLLSWEHVDNNIGKINEFSLPHYYLLLSLSHYPSYNPWSLE